MYYDEKVDENIQITHNDVAEHFSNLWNCRIARNTVRQQLKRRKFIMIILCCISQVLSVEESQSILIWNNVCIFGFQTKEEIIFQFMKAC